MLIEINYFLRVNFAYKPIKNKMFNGFVLKVATRAKTNSGFTLIELLVTIIIIGVLSAIALPSFLNQASKARQSEAKTTISTVNSAQNAFRTENNSFAPDMQSLALGLPTTTNNYEFNLVGNQDTATITATSIDTSVRGYAGGTVRYGGIEQSAIASIVCEVKVASTNVPVLPTLNPSQTTPETAAKCDSSQEKLKWKSIELNLLFPTAANNAQTKAVLIVL